jgi:hypothetical protein
MIFAPTENHVNILRAVGWSANGIEAVAERRFGLECVAYGWLDHAEHRRDDGGIVDVWSLTDRGRLILKNREREILHASLIEAA